MKIKLITTQPHGACSYYRSLGVFQKIKDLQIDSTGEFDWYNINDVDCIFFERPITENHLLAIKYAKDYGVKVWVDYDDNLLEIPTWNPMFSFLTNKITQETIIKCLSLSDVVTVPTVALKEQLQKYNKNIEIIPNAFNDHNFDFKYNPSKNQKILWRGSITHRKDILYYQKMLVDAAAANKNWEWNFIGKDIWYITEPIANKKEHPELNIIPYFSRIKSINPAIYIVPLYPCAFNEAKCLIGETLVITKNGIKQISNISEENEEIWQDYKYKKINNYFKYKDKNIIKIITESGYTISGTFNHKLRIENEFKKMEYLNIGDEIELSY